MPWLSLIIFLIITASVAAVGAITQPGIFYENLAKPDWNPPSWIFGPVWTVLYIMIAIAGWMIWRRKGLSVVMVIWVMQIILNAVWSVLAFQLNRLDFSFYDIFALWITIILFIFLAWPIHRTASYLFIPYLLWVSFAAWLNYTLWQLNPIS